VSLFQMSSTPFRVGQVSLMRSHLSRVGASYTRVVSVPLAVA
jgi:2'-5' RNA ligase